MRKQFCDEIIDATKAYVPFSYLAKNITDEQHDRILKTIAMHQEVTLVSEDKIELIKISVQNDNYAVKNQQTGEAG